MSYGTIAYESRKFSKGALDVISTANAICAQYAAQGYDITLRQLYYQFVARGYIANKQSEYKRLGDIINNARMAGELSWDYIVDRTRNVHRPPAWGSPQDILDVVAQQFRRNPWETQPNHVEVWVEKEALAGVVQRSADALRVPSLACRGYMSQSEQHAAGMRFLDCVRAGQTVHVIHLGDHDPSGIDMSRDNHARLRTFVYSHLLNEMPETSRATVAEIERYAALRYNSDGIKLNRIALNMDQVEQYDPPPNPAKLTDARAEGYIERFGDESWELDALPPDVLDTLITDAVQDLIDDDAWTATMDQERLDRMNLRLITERYESVLHTLSARFAER